MNDKEENELAHEGTESQFSAIKNFSIPVPFRPVTRSLCKHPTKTSTSQALPMGENKQSPHLRRSPWAMDSHMIKAATKC